MDVKKIGKIPDGGAWRAHGRQMGSICKKRARIDSTTTCTQPHAEAFLTVRLNDGHAFGRARHRFGPERRPVVFSIVDLAAVLEQPSREITEALRELDIPATWSLSIAVAAAAPSTRPGSTLTPNPRRVQAFQNLVVGTLAERVFVDHLERLKPKFDVEDLHERGENRDFAVRRAGSELPINVKVASTLFRKALETVGLAPENCVPVSAYKAIGACERMPDLLYVDLVDFTLREKVDAFMNNMGGSLGIGWHLLSWFAGTGARAAQDQYVKRLFELNGDSLKHLAPAISNFRAISAQRVLAIMRKNPRRVPGLGVKGAGTGGFSAEVNVHISVADETRAWDVIEKALLSTGIDPLLEEIRRTAQSVVAAPSL